MTKPENERLAIVETKLEGIDRRTQSIESKLDTVLEAHNKQSGAVRLAILLWTGLVAAAGVIVAWFR